ncbi:xaa-Pro dipeptidase-like, partial [Tribolium castaneum]|uniref:xaa-Pro dipeptidase-like n=1 Tax=Tribolium castaneum TaxID=7070 RepID=UPI0030FE1C4C
PQTSKNQFSKISGPHKPYRDDSEQYSLKKIDTKVWDASKPGRLWNGPGTYEIPVELYAENRKRLIEQIHAKDPGKPVILLQGGDEIPFYDTDITYSVFRQESNFLWTFGVTEPGCFGAIDIATKKTFLFVPRFPTSYLIWRGPLPSLEDISRKYQIPNVHHKDNIASILRNLNPSVLLTLKGVNSDSNLLSREAHFEGIDKFRVNNTVLYNEIANLRVYKTDFELDVMRYVSDISSEAHRKVMRFAKPGKTEYQCEAEFLHYCYATGGCRHTSYTCICASGANGAILHYGHAAAPNNKMIEPGDLCLFDMGANYFGYCADITCTFPANGKFSPSQKLIYEAVLLTNTTVFKSLKPGVSWLEMHTLAHRVLLGELKKGGLLKGDVEAMVAAGLGGVFQPHGLGHLLGLDVHDVGGFIGAKRSDLKGAAMLRTTRELKERMVITVEPGCYFIDVLLDEALESAALSRFLVADVIKRFRGFGGVRIEDNVLITKNGAVSLTKVPRSVKEVEDWIAGKDSKTYH